MNNPNKKAWLGFVFLALVMGLLLFVPAWTIRYWQAEVSLAIYFGSSLLTMLYLIKKDPAIFAVRLSNGPEAEKEITQKIIMAFVSIAFVAVLVVPALDRRFGWSRVSPLAGPTADILVTGGVI